MIYVGEDPSEIKQLLSRIPTRCIVAKKQESNFTFVVTKSKNIKYKVLERVLKLYKFTPTNSLYVRGTMAVVAAKTEKESGDMHGGIIELRVFVGEDVSNLPDEPKMKKTADVSKIKVIKDVEIPKNYKLEFKKSGPGTSKSQSENA